jgi:hypothetical protein
MEANLQRKDSIAKYRVYVLRHNHGILDFICYFVLCLLFGQVRFQFIEVNGTGEIDQPLSPRFIKFPKLVYGPSYLTEFNYPAPKK